MITEERIWKRGQKQTYTDRPLTDEERRFAGDWENYKKLYEFMHYYRMDEEEWFDILIIPYLQSVKKYHVREDLRANYKFWHVCNLMLSKAVYNHNRAMKRQKRMPDGGFISLDYTLQGDNPFCEYQVEEWWIDRKQQVETIVLDKELFMEILMELDKEQREIFEMLLEGYKKSEIKRTLNISSALLEHEMEYIRNVTYMCMA